MDDDNGDDNRRNEIHLRKDISITHAHNEQHAVLTMKQPATQSLGTNVFITYLGCQRPTSNEVSSPFLPLSYSVEGTGTHCVVKLAACLQL